MEKTAPNGTTTLYPRKPTKNLYRINNRIEKVTREQDFLPLL